MLRDNRIVLGLAVLIVLAPLVLPWTKGAEFGGADDRAKGVVGELRPGYEPWFTPLWEPPSGEVASLLFALQASLGTGVLAYYAGLRRGRREGRAERDARP